jgi:lysophospholipase L1-like esterase
MPRERRSKYANDAKDTAGIASQVESLSSSLAQKANKTDIENLIDGSPKGTYATLSALQTAYPSGTTGIYLVTAGGKWYYWNGSAWTAGGIYQSTGIANGSITPGTTSFFKVSSNLFNKENVLNGYYVDFSGNPIVSEPHSLSEYIEVSAGTNYIFKHTPFAGAFYDSSKTFISASMENPVTSPANAKYFRFGTHVDNLESQQMNEGSVLLAYEPFYNRLENDVVEAESIKDKSIPLSKFSNDVLFLLDSSNKGSYFNDIIKSLKNPFVKTKIKLLGDSITFGAGGTGNATEGELIGNPAIGTTKANVLTAVCWANMLYEFVSNKFNKEQYIETSNPNLTYSASYIQIESGNAILPFIRSLNNESNSGKGIEFTFYGNHFSIFYTGKNNGGILDILVDGVSVSKLDTYNATDNTYKQEKVISGLTLGNHSVKIVETGTKQSSSAGNVAWIEGLKIPKTAIVKNWGWSGSTSSFLTTFKTNLIESDDDIVFIQFGTNDRPIYTSPAATKSYQREAVKYIQGLGKKVVLMTAPPSVLDVENGVLNFGAEDVDSAISDLATEFAIPYISNYKGYVDYMRETSTGITDLLADSLHPNDLGYKVMYQNIMSNLGLSYLGDGMTY